MPVTVETRGAEQMRRVARALREAGDKEMRAELYRGLNRAVKPLRQDAKLSAARVLPQRGGLALRVARTRITTRRRTGRNPGLSLVALPNAVKDPRRIDRGMVRHPVFGRGSVLQQVEPGWFSEPMRKGAPRVRRELVVALTMMERKLSRR